MTFFSRSDSVWSTPSSCSWSRMKLAASTGTAASASSVEQPRCESSSSSVRVVGVLEEFAGLRVFLFAERRVERDGLLRDLLDLTHLLGADPHHLADLFGRGF